MKRWKVLALATRAASALHQAPALSGTIRDIPRHAASSPLHAPVQASDSRTDGHHTVCRVGDRQIDWCCREVGVASARMSPNQESNCGHCDEVKLGCPNRDRERELVGKETEGNRTVGIRRADVGKYRHPHCGNADYVCCDYPALPPISVVGHPPHSKWHSGLVRKRTWN